MQDTNTGAAAAAPGTLTLAGQDVTLERVSARKASRILAELRAITAAVPDITRAIGEFVRSYEATNMLELNRTQARYQLPDRTAHMTDADWQAADGVLRLPESPATPEVIAAVFPLALDLAEEHVYRLLALFTMSNSDVKRARREGTLAERLEERADDLLDDAGFDELLELAVVVGEVIDAQVRGKVEALGDRLGNAMRLLGMAPTRSSSSPASEPAQSTSSSPDDEPTDDSEPTAGSSTPSSSSSRPKSATDSPATSDATRSPSSTNPSTSSAPSAPDSTASEPSARPLITAP